jgi:hypothetical protein
MLYLFSINGPTATGTSSSNASKRSKTGAKPPATAAVVHVTAADTTTGRADDFDHLVADLFENQFVLLKFLNS